MYWVRKLGRILSVIPLLLLPACTPTEPDPPPLEVVPTPRPTATPVPRLSAAGCSLSSLSGAFPNNSGLLPSTGNAAIDNAFRIEGQFLVSAFGLSPQGWFFFDGANPNAYANPQVTSPFGPDGTIVMGINLIQGELYRDGGAGLAIPAILAHEMGHIAQFRTGVRHPVTAVNELHSDFLAGWYLARRGYNYVTVRPAFQSFFEKGGYQFNDPNFHGTPSQRLLAIQSGFGSGPAPLNAAFQQGFALARQILGV